MIKKEKKKRTGQKRKETKKRNKMKVSAISFAASLFAHVSFISVPWGCLETKVLSLNM